MVENEFNPTTHPRQKFLFFIEEDLENEINESEIENLRNVVELLSMSNDWIISPPQFVNESDNDSGAITNICGCLLETYCSFPPLDKLIPREVHETLFAEAILVIEAFKDYSQETSHTVTLELDDVYVGSIVKGVYDKSLRLGLIGEWEKNLNS